MVRKARALIIVCAVALTACPHPAPINGGQHEEGEPTHPKFEARKDDTADTALSQAQALEQRGAKAKAIEAYLAVRRTYPDTTAGQEALYRAGVLYFEEGDYPNARKSLGELVYENPLFEKANDARLKAGLAAIELGAYQDAYQSLTSLAEKTEGELHDQAVAGAQRAAAMGGLSGPELQQALKQVEQAQSVDDQKTALDHLRDLIESNVPFVEIARAQQSLSTSHPAWPLLTFKLARIYYHLRDWTRLDETLQAFLHNAPQSPYAAEAQEMLARAQRRSEVHPKTLGVVLPLSGKYAPLGEAVLRGIKLAMAGSNIELVVKDDQGDVTAAGKAVEDLAFESGVVGILGPVLAENARRAALVAEELQVPILTLTRQEDITDLGPHVFRNMLTNSAQAKALARYGTEVLGYKTFAVLYPNIPYGLELMNEFWDQLNKDGAQLHAAESYEHDQTTFTTEVKKLVGRYYLEDRSDWIEGLREINAQNLDSFHKRKALEKLKSSLQPVVDFEALFIPDDWRRVGLVAPALAVEDIITNACDPKDLEKIKKTTGRKDLKTVTLLGTNQWSSPKGRSGLPELVERGGKFVACSIYVDGFFVDSARPATRKFVAAYKERYKDQPEPGLLEATGYDSAAILRHVLSAQKPQTREALRDDLSTVKNFEGATGKTSFGDDRDAQKPLFFLTIDPKGVHELPNAEKVSGT